MFYFRHFTVFYLFFKMPPKHSKPLVCPVCTRDHEMADCVSFRNMSVPVREQYCINTKRCLRCLETVAKCQGHPPVDGRPAVCCKVCHSGDHHTVLHHRKPVIMVTNPAPSVPATGCIRCGREHALESCPEFLSCSVRARFSYCSQKRICFVCLTKCGEKCVVTPDRHCAFCGSDRHHRVLHDQQWNPKNDRGKGPRQKTVCRRCNEEHRIEECKDILKLPTAQRRVLCLAFGICPRCMQSYEQCQTRCQELGLPKCSICGSEEHHTILHVEAAGVRPDGNSNVSNAPVQRCPQCGDGHHLTSCFQFFLLSIGEKLKLCQTRSICARCLTPAEICKSKCFDERRIACSRCFSGLHHTFLHVPLAENGSAYTAAAARAYSSPYEDDTKANCPHCQGDHRLEHCPMFGTLAVSQKELRLKQLGLCRICLESPHSGNCGIMTCHYCGEKTHNAMLHQFIDDPSGSVIASATGQRQPITTTVINNDTPAGSLSLLEKPSGAEKIKEKEQTFITREDLNRVLAGLKTTLVKKKRDEEITNTSTEPVAGPSTRPDPAQKCLVCGYERHPLEICPEFVGSGYWRRQTLVQIYGICCYCLEVGHSGVECKKPAQTCDFNGCKQRHHPLLHKLTYDDNLTVEQNALRSTRIERLGNERFCQLCYSSKHTIDECTHWPACRTDRIAEAEYYGLCPKCLTKKHLDDTCSVEEQVCGVNGCPYSHHPLLHPTRMTPMTLPNRPRFEDRRPHEDISTDDRGREERDINGERLERLLKDHYMGPTTIFPYAKRKREEVTYCRYKRRMHHIVLTRGTFQRLYECYCRAPAGVENQDTDSEDLETSSDDSSSESNNERPAPKSKKGSGKKRRK
jgi:hypothetical protein